MLCRTYTREMHYGIETRWRTINKTILKFALHLSVFWCGKRTVDRWLQLFSLWFLLHAAFLFMRNGISFPRFFQHGKDTLAHKVMHSITSYSKSKIRSQKKDFQGMIFFQGMNLFQEMILFQGMILSQGMNLFQGMILRRSIEAWVSIFNVDQYINKHFDLQSINQ